MGSINSGVYHYGYVFQHGDLPLYVTDSANNPVSPYRVTYTMYYYPKNSECAFRVGAEDRTPVSIGVGEYYATGFAGQCGQPGDWYVEWKIQESFESPVTVQKYHFKVFDSSQYCNYGVIPAPSSPSCKCSKFRW